MRQQFDIREVTAAHAQVLAMLHGESFEEAWSADTLASALSQPGALALLAVANEDAPLGFVMARAALFEGGGEAEILTIATRPQARRLGVARALLLAARDRLQAMGVARMFLEVAEDNAPARALYESLGFTTVGRRTGYYARADGARADAWVLALDLDD